MDRSPRVVIVGGGISAIAAAHLLISEGFEDVVILEATDRIGGRIWSIDLRKFTVQEPCYRREDRAMPL